MQNIKCNHCDHIQSEEELLIVGDDEACTKCQRTDGLMDIECPHQFNTTNTQSRSKRCVKCGYITKEI